MKTTFVHNVLCGHCFIMSRRLREIKEEHPSLEIDHRSFPLRWDPYSNEEHDQGDVKEMKNKWELANRIDEESRFNVEKLDQASFPYPTSRLPMLAIRAGVRVGGDPWDLFDLFQSAFFEEVKNISQIEVIEDLISKTSLDMEEWQTAFNDPETEIRELEDFKWADKKDLTLIPAMVVNDTHLIQGTKRKDLAVDLIQEALEKDGESLK